MPDPNYVAQTPALPDDSVLSHATPASALPPSAHRHRRHSSRRARRKRRQQQIIIGVIVLAVIAVGAILLLPDKSSKTSTTSAPATTATTAAGPAGPVSWTHVDLQGKSVTVLPGAGSTRFVVVNGKHVPAVLAAFDSALAHKGCAGAQPVYEKLVANKPAAPKSADRQSAYAAYEIEQAKAKHCSWATAPS